MKKAIVLCSGGLDSVTSAYYAKNKLKYDEIVIMFFNYGQRALSAERECAKKCAAALKSRFIEVGLGWLGKISDSLLNSNCSPSNIAGVSVKELKDTKKEGAKWYVPARNLSFISTAVSFAEAFSLKDKKSKWDIITGFKNEGKEFFPDASKKFVDEFNKLNSVGTESKPKIIAPLIKMDKEDIILFGIKLGINYHDTFSCYSSLNEKHCGICLACRLRQQGFKWANINDPTEYHCRA